MEGSSTKLAFLTTFLILASGLPFRRTIGLGAQAQTHECEEDAECERVCDSGGCFKNYLGLRSMCLNHICSCPFGRGQTVTKSIRNSVCYFDGDCSTLCPSDCTVRSCRNSKCECGCRG